jgi:DNA-binding IclR family transcriptional regulator
LLTIFSRFETLETKYEYSPSNTIVECAALDAELDATQARGYSEDREKNEEQIFCYGGAILGADGEPLACVSISIPLYRKSATPLVTYIAPLKDACRDCRRCRPRIARN